MSNTVRIMSVIRISSTRFGICDDLSFDPVGGDFTRRGGGGLTCSTGSVFDSEGAVGRDGDDVTFDPWVKLPVGCVGCVGCVGRDGDDVTFDPIDCGGSASGVRPCGCDGDDVSFDG